MSEFNDVTCPTCGHTYGYHAWQEMQQQRDKPYRRLDDLIEIEIIRAFVERVEKRIYEAAGKQGAWQNWAIRKELAAMEADNAGTND
jgi:hypothetical protein